MPARTFDPMYTPLITTVPLPTIPGVVDRYSPNNRRSDAYYPPASSSSSSSNESYSPPIHPPHSHLGLFTAPPSPYTGGPVRIHPLLALGGGMDWDVVCAPGEESIRIPSGKRGEWTHIAPHVLMEPATYPALPSMTILCNRLPWQIRITPLSSSHYRPNFVTLSDVVTTLYTTLRTPVSSAEFGSLPHAEQRYVSDAFTERWKSVGGGHREKEREKAKGIKRVDWFCGRTGFDGLDRMSGGGEKWVLRVGGGG